MMRTRVLLFVLLVGSLSACSRNGGQPVGAADFKLQDLSGKSVKLSDFRGRPVLLDFWATWCPPCRESIPAIEKIHENYNGRGLVVLGISVDEGGWDSVSAFVQQNRITYPVLKGTDNVSSEYQVRTIPMAILLNRDGKIVKRYLGFGGEDELEKDIKALL